MILASETMGVGRHDAIDIGINFYFSASTATPKAAADVSLPPRPKVVMLPSISVTPWNPQMTGMIPLFDKGFQCLGTDCLDLGIAKISICHHTSLSTCQGFGLEAFLLQGGSHNR